jgi:anti-sigma factor RsiW
MSTPERHVGGLWCREVLEHLPDLLEGDLPADTTAAVHAHLAGCDLCTRFGGAYAGVVATLRRPLPPPPDGDDLAAVTQALRDVR